MRYLLLSGLGVLASLAFIAASMTMNYLYGVSLGRNALESQLWGAVSIASDALKALAPIFLFWALRSRQWGLALVCLVGLVVTTGYALQSAAGFASESKSVVIGGRESVRATYLEAEDELADASKRREAMKVARSPAEIEAAIQATLTRAVKDGDRVRGTVTSLSAGCTRADARTADACREVGELRQALAGATSAARLDQRLDQLRKQVRDLRDKGGGVDANPQATLLSKLTLGKLSPADVEAWKSIYLALLVEFMSVFGLLMSLEHRELKKAWREMRPEVAVATPASPLAEVLPLGGVDKFLGDCLQPAAGKVVEVGEVYAAYQAWCGRHKLRPLSVETFAEPFARICQHIGVRTRSKGKKVYCVDVQVAA